MVVEVINNRARAVVDLLGVACSPGGRLLVLLLVVPGRAGGRQGGTGGASWAGRVDGGSGCNKSSVKLWGPVSQLV